MKLDLPRRMEAAAGKEKSSKLVSIYKSINWNAKLNKFQQNDETGHFSKHFWAGSKFQLLEFKPDYTEIASLGFSSFSATL